jgi:hypothetical protein
MTLRTVTTFSKIALAVLIPAFALPALAEDVTFTTTGEFGCGTVAGACSTSSAYGSATGQIAITQNNNTFTLAAEGYTNTSVQAGNPALDDVNVLTFLDTVTQKGNAGGGTGDPVSLNGATFSLLFTQTAPPTTPDSGALSGELTGKITASQTSTIITFSSSSLVIGNIKYTLDDGTTWTIPNPGNPPTIGMTTETATVTPEPTFMALTGLGFAGLAFAAYRRKRAV